jgi:hypothetical protein
MIGSQHGGMPLFLLYHGIRHKNVVPARDQCLLSTQVEKETKVLDMYIQQEASSWNIRHCLNKTMS